MSDFHDRKPIACECGDHIFQSLNRGHLILVSPVDEDLLTGERWSVIERRRKGPSGDLKPYFSVWRKRVIAGRRIAEYLARRVLRLGKGVVADHRNGDTLDNRRRNLRPAAAWQNAVNIKAPQRALPRGVRVTNGGKYQAHIKAGGARHYLGTFDTPETAFSAYRQAALRVHGDFARFD